VHVLLIADQSSVHDLLTPVLREAFSDVVIGSERNFEGAIAYVHRCGRMDLLLIDLGLAGCSGVEALTRLRDKLPPCRIVVFATLDERALIFAALRAGAAGYLSRGCPPKIMSAALRLVAAGGLYLPPEVLPRQVRVPVTAGQREVLRLLLKKYSNQRIAAELAISPRTVRQHTHALFDAFGISSRAQLRATLRTSSTR
jgi:DNA-binding NarL/FixJ family response regulator